VSHGNQRRPQHHNPSPPEAWPAARAAAKWLIAPVERFLSIEASSGILLLAAASVALLWANSPWRDSYQALWHTALGLRLGALTFERDLHFWINDGLMVIFFFVVGLEIRREVHAGELSEPRRAALPAMAALGGMIVPACIYVLLNGGTPAIRGWGVPMATDIAFAVGVLALLGKRVPPALRILLLALAVIDDLGAIIVIALFYSSGIDLSGFVVAVVGLMLVILFQKLGIRRPWVYLFPGLVVWGGTYAAGVHPTLAGVALGLLTPVRPWLSAREFVDQATATVNEVRAAGTGVDQVELVARLAELDVPIREAVSPVERLQYALHGWVAFVIMPLFALANAGVPLGDARLTGETGAVFLGVAAGLVLGKPLGVVGFSWIAVRIGIAALPGGVGWTQVLVVGVVAGIGFTMALFVATLAFGPGVQLEAAKLGILCASAAAGVFGLTVGRFLLSGVVGPGAARTDAQAESSTSA
jgi:NhaA family Na+:H+ antiporter